MDLPIGTAPQILRQIVQDRTFRASEEAIREQYSPRKRIADYATILAVLSATFPPSDKGRVARHPLSVREPRADAGKGRLELGGNYWKLSTRTMSLVKASSWV
jgi:hypothetical protein